MAGYGPITSKLSTTRLRSLGVWASGLVVVVHERDRVDVRSAGSRDPGFVDLRRVGDRLDVDHAHGFFVEANRHFDRLGAGLLAVGPHAEDVITLAIRFAAWCGPLPRKSAFERLPE